MAQRFGASSLHQRDSRSALFEGYTGDAASRRPVSASPNRGYGYGGYGAPRLPPWTGRFRCIETWFVPLCDAE
ncbi:protein transport protein bet1 [Fusarium oxysporum]|nr:protein transport protein bet1 [Fusarium oxysporum]